MERLTLHGFEQKVEHAFMELDPSFLAEQIISQMETYEWPEQLRFDFIAR